MGPLYLPQRVGILQGCRRVEGLEALGAWIFAGGDAMGSVVHRLNKPTALLMSTDALLTDKFASLRERAEAFYLRAAPCAVFGCEGWILKFEVVDNIVKW